MPLIGPRSVPDRSQIGPKSVPNRSQIGPRIGPRSVPDRSQIGPRSVPDRSQIGPRSGPRSVPDRSQIGPRSVPDRSQIGPRSVPDRSQIGPRSVPDRSQIGPHICHLCHQEDGQMGHGVGGEPGQGLLAQRWPGPGHHQGPVHEVRDRAPLGLPEVLVARGTGPVPVASCQWVAPVGPPEAVVARGIWSPMSPGVGASGCRWGWCTHLLFPVCQQVAPVWAVGGSASLPVFLFCFGCIGHRHTAGAGAMLAGGLSNQATNPRPPQSVWCDSEAGAQSKRFTEQYQIQCPVCLPLSQAAGSQASPPSGGPVQPSPSTVASQTCTSRAHAWVS